MLELERHWEELGVGYLMPCWPQEPVQRYNTLIVSISAMIVCNHLQQVNESIRLALAFPLPGRIGDWAVPLRGQCRRFLC